MSVSDTFDEQIVATYQTNAAPWIAAVREARIDSRRLVTDAAILNVVTALRPERVLDLGCGEGWLSRALTARGCQCLGIDAVPALIEAARTADPQGDYRVLDYAAVVRGQLAARVDVIVCNFSLFGADPLMAMLARLPAHLQRPGHLVIQTLHPHTAGDERYADGWRQGSWAGFGAAFRDPAPWYFRTLESWIGSLTASGFRLTDLREPLHPVSGRPASLILTAAAV